MLWSQVHEAGPGWSWSRDESDTIPALQGHSEEEHGSGSMVSIRERGETSREGGFSGFLYLFQKERKGLFFDQKHGEARVCALEYVLSPKTSRAAL